MKKLTKWHAWLILAVIALTVYNILPTLFFYLQPLKASIDEKRGMRIATEVAHRVEVSQDESLSWLKSYCQLLGIEPASIRAEAEVIRVQCVQVKEAARLRFYLQRAGSLVVNPSAQLTALPPSESSPKTVSLLRKIPSQFDAQLFRFADAKSPLHIDSILDRAAMLAAATGGSRELSQILTQKTPAEDDLLNFASQINRVHEQFHEHPAIEARFASNLLLGSVPSRPALLDNLLESMSQLRRKFETDKSKEKETALVLAQVFIKKHRALFEKNREALSFDKAQGLLRAQSRLDLSPYSSFFQELTIDWEKNQLLLRLHNDLAALDPKSFEQLLINEAAVISRVCNETLKPQEASFAITLNQRQDATSFLVLDLEQCTESLKQAQKRLLMTEWNPAHPDLAKANYPIVDKEEFDALSQLSQKLCLSIQAKQGSLQITAHGLQRILAQAEESPDVVATEQLQADVRSLVQLLQASGCFLSSAQGGDFVFEKQSAFAPLIASLREEFQIRGSKRFAVLEFSTLEQRILAENRIDTAIHEELLKWHDEYAACQVSLDAKNRFDVPKPNRSKLLSNFLLSMKKMFRGDDKRIIRWGLDLSGGKSVQIQLCDAANRPVIDEMDLKQGMNELYQRVNKMGVSEVAIRRVGTDIVLDFPGSQAMSASELIQASSMVFHVVNEKFSSFNSEAANRFLQEVWNEALISNRKDAQSVHAIAYKQLQERQNEAARTLYEDGLRLQSPDTASTIALDESVSKIALLRGDGPNEWRQMHPLLIVFGHAALEGSDLAQIHTGSDSSNGNFLAFNVDKQAQEGLYAWTSRFSKETILGTPYETYSRGQGWRMAVILNGTIISSPTLNSALKDSAMINGSFSQREVTQLASDLKAGSLSFTPKILSEKNVSPELGAADRAKGISATIAALVLVVLSMGIYYRFGGVVASVAVLFNLLIMWAVLQNLQATLTLAGIAGIILTVGMAVDANVLVFERIKEELRLTDKIGPAIQAGYEKAFSAILDSNVTTIIAALILLNFDAGPIKGFAITLIIGIASSMFTALFMTRAYFSYWVQRGSNRMLKMADWIRATSYDFLKKAKLSFVLSLVIVLAGAFLMISNRSNILGMDFTGGFAVELELQKGDAHALEQALLQKGASSKDFQVRELNPSHFRVLLSTNLNEKGCGVDWLLNACQENQLPLTKECLANVRTNWTSISGQMSDSMRNHALLGLGLALVCIFIYLTFRFEAGYAASAIFCLVHDVLITAAVMGICNAFGLPVQIDLNTVAAIMTIVGYSLNDTIIIFDRIREESRGLSPTPRIVNGAINATLSRTSITSGTTLLVLIALLLLGGSTIFSFAFVMTIGVFFGTLSSWFIASPLLLFFHKQDRELSIIGKN